MQKPLFKKNNDPNITSYHYQNHLIAETKTAKELIQQELTINKLYQQELQKRILILKESLQNTPKNAPYTTYLMTQLDMDRIELDELKIREKEIEKKYTN